MTKKLTDQEMLEELIKLADKHGWNKLGYNYLEVCPVNDPFMFAGGYGKSPGEVIKMDYLFNISLETVLFNHDFARAVFGTEYAPFPYWCRETMINVPIWKKAWQYHLQQLAITPEKDRIRYCYEHRRRD